MIKQALACFICLYIGFYTYANITPEGNLTGIHDFSYPVKFYEDTICPGETALLIVDAGPQAIIQWMEDGRVIHMGDSLQTPTLTESKTYKVLYKLKAKSESKVKFLTATVETSDKMAIKGDPPNLDRPNEEVTFSLIGSMTIRSYEWNFGDGKTDSVKIPKHEYGFPGRYEVSVTVTSDKGCKFLLSKIFTIEQPPYIDFPSAFSPNGDGYNDSLRIAYYDLSSFILKIFDRKGDLIYETENPDFHWDGVDIYGDVAPEGVYTCKISALTTEKKSIKKEHILTLIR